MENRILPLFPRPLYLSGDKFLSDDDFDIWTKDLISMLEKEPMNENIGGNFGTVDQYIFNRPEFAHLKEYVLQHISCFIHDGLKIKKHNEFYITQSWINVNNTGSGHHTHRHYNSLVSGIFYVLGDLCPTTFINSNHGPLGLMFGFSVEEYNALNAGIRAVENTPNTLILFPSGMDHYVETNEANKTRISIGFNSFVSGLIGTPEEGNLLHLKKEGEVESPLIKGEQVCL